MNTRQEKAERYVSDLSPIESFPKEELKAAYMNGLIDAETLKLNECGTFGQAIQSLKRGLLVTRKGWNGKGMFFFMRPSDQLPTEMVVNKVKSLPESFKKWVADNYGDSTSDVIHFTSYICMKAADNTVVNGWLASQTDMLSEDWILFE